ncbi:MAG: prepilin-type N-terminal cleavage/methylation domain-containing protein [Syntrophobacterales bacterium]|nr:prepilin-type N-terminal cleavage/methylation domain-containing protein [Syntrophobacterales bacterium]
MRYFRKDNKGFTLIEIIIVLLLVCIIGAVILISGVYSTSGNDLPSQTEVIKGHLRYAQTRAMNTNTIWGIKFFRSEGRSCYYLFQLDESNNETMVVLPGETASPVALPEGMAVSVGTVSFDSWGKPYTDATAQTAQAEAGGWRNVSVSLGGDTQTITIRNNTGFIP